MQPAYTFPSLGNIALLLIAKAVKSNFAVSLNRGFTRVHDLSVALNVQPPSATKMVQKLSELKLLKYEKYGVLKLEKNGELLGEALLKRHNVIEKFLKILGVAESEVLTETEKIEHTITKKTTKCFENFIEFSDKNPEIIARYKSYIDENNE